MSKSVFGGPQTFNSIIDPAGSQKHQMVKVEQGSADHFSLITSNESHVAN